MIQLLFVFFFYRIYFFFFGNVYLTFSSSINILGHPVSDEHSRPTYPILSKITRLFIAQLNKST